MTSVEDFEEFWLDNMVLDVIDVPLTDTQVALGGADVSVVWEDFGKVRTLTVEIMHPDFEIRYDVNYDQRMVNGDKYRVILTNDDRYRVMEGCDSPNAFDPFFAWLADNSTRSTDTLQNQVAAITVTRISRVEA